MLDNLKDFKNNSAFCMFLISLLQVGGTKSLLQRKVGTVTPCYYQGFHIGETKFNFALRKAEHENKTHNSEPARHLAKNSDHLYIHMEHRIQGKHLFEAK